MQTDLPDAVMQRLIHEFQHLVTEQEEALRNATFCGMTAEVAQQCDERRAQIANIGKQIDSLNGRVP